MRSTVAAAERARLRERARLVQAGVLDDSFFEGKPAARGAPARAGTKRKVSFAADTKPPSDDDDDDDDELSRPRRRRANAQASIDAPLHGIVPGQDEDQSDGSKMGKKRRKPEDGDSDDDDLGVDEDLKDDLANAEEAYGEDDVTRLAEKDGAQVPLMAFNLDEERQVGGFDEAGNFVWRRRDLEEEEADDPWMQSVKEQEENGSKPDRDKKLVDEAPKGRPVKRRTARSQSQPVSLQAHKQTLVDMLENGESVIVALKRLAKDTKKLDALTAAAHALIESMPEVYQTTRRTLDADIQEERAALMDKTMWQYRTSMDANAEVHGPFTATQMQSWRDEGYFDKDDDDDQDDDQDDAGEPQSVFVRKAPSPGAEDASGDVSQPSAKKRKVEFAETAALDAAADFDDDDDDGNNDDDGDGDKEQQRPPLHQTQKSDDGTGWVPVETVNFRAVFS